MKITICGSVKFIGEMKNIKAMLEEQGHKILLPLSAETNQGKAFWKNLKDGDINKFVSLHGDYMKKHFENIESSDAILVLNYDKDGKINYIGPGTFLDAGLAFHLWKKIFILNALDDADAKHEEMISMHPIILNGNLSNIK